MQPDNGFSISRYIYVSEHLIYINDIPQNIHKRSCVWQFIIGLFLLQQHNGMNHLKTETLLLLNCGS